VGPEASPILDVPLAAGWEDPAGIDRIFDAWPEDDREEMGGDGQEDWPEADAAE
jgi:hypothetical protein